MQFIEIFCIICRKGAIIMSRISLKYNTDEYDNLNYKKDFADILRTAISVESNKIRENMQEPEMYSYQEL